MDKLFGIPMTNIMWVLVGLFAISVAGVAAIWLCNRIMFRMGLRNIPRRRAQSALVVLGLMLATLIITAAVTTGDTLDYSITSLTYDNLQRTDLTLNFQGDGSGGGDADAGGQIYADQRFVTGLEVIFQDDADIEGFMPFLFEQVPALNSRTRLSEPSVFLSGIDRQALSRFGGLRRADGGRADLGALGENQVLINESAAEKLEARTGDVITVFAQGVPWELQVVGVVKDERASGVLTFGEGAVPGIAALLPTVQRLTGHVGQINSVSVVLKGDERSSVKRSDAAAERLDDFLTSDTGKLMLGLGDLGVQVEKNKQDAVKEAELWGNVFTTFFLVLGLFSIAAGVLLIFMIFVMLAAERKTEMGMARAVGAKRMHLVQSFVAEGMAYNVMAGAVGAALGVGAAFGLVVGGARLVAGEELSFFKPYVTPRSLVISYCLGVVLTFITVVISSLRISQLNIVAAIRGVDDDRRREGRRRTRWLWVALGIPALIVPPLGLWLLLRKGFGLPWTWILGPAGIVLSAALMWLGHSIDKLFPFALGISLLPLCVAGLARYYHAPSRPTWSAVGGLLAIYWLMPGDWHERLFGKLDGNVEMFVLSGIMIVTGFTLLIVFNARLLTALFEGMGGAGHAFHVPLLLVGGTLAAAALGWAIGDAGDGLGQLCYLLAALLAIAALLSFVAARFPRLGPALKMGVAYPLASRSRTGMTIAMFSLIVFSLTVMSVLNANFGALFASDEARGGWDVVADTNRNNPVDDLRAALREEGSFDPAQIMDIGRTTGWRGVQEVRQAGRDDDWKQYLVRAGDDAFFAASRTTIDIRARGYGSDREIFAAVRTQPSLAVIDAMAISSSGFGGGGGWTVHGVKSTDTEFEPFDVEIRDPLTGKVGKVTVIGVLSQKLSEDLMSGIYTNERTFAEVFGTPEYRRHYLRLTPGADADAAAKGIKAALVTQGVQAYGIEKQIDEGQEMERGFNRIFQAFMGLGLFVGIAALGVIAFRSVVERRQQIGMLRAIGYQRGTVALTFLLEASFVALMGILSGVVGAAILSRNLLSSEEFTSTSRAGFSFFIPWTEVITFVVIAYVFSLLLTWWPSRGAARVPIAEALRYE